MTVRAWEHLATTDLPAPAGAVALLPVAAVEQHGPHLPLGTDAILTDGVVDAALAKLPAEVEILRLPTQRIGLSPEHAAFPGTLTLEPETVIALWSEIGASVARAGIAKLALVNGHGGQSGLVDLVATRLRTRHGMAVLRVTYFDLVGPEDLLPERERAFGWHGGTVETALMRAIAPDLVDMTKATAFDSAAERVAARNGELRVEGPVGLAWTAEDLNPAGPTGDAGAATAELGRDLLDHTAGRLATALTEFAGWPWPPGGA